MRVVITGAAGCIGTITARALSDTHELVLIDRRRKGGRNSFVGDLSRHPASRPRSISSWLQRWPRAFSGADVLVHLAGNPRPAASWRTVARDNIEATGNVFEVAAQYEIPRVIYASSNHAVRVLVEQLAPDCWQPSGPKIDSTASPRPKSRYGMSKALGELLGRGFVDTGRFRSFIAVRIGHCHPSGKPFAADVAAHNHWIGLHDMASIMRRCVEADLEGFHVVYAVSGQAESPYDLTYTKALLSWEPEERAEPLSESVNS